MSSPTTRQAEILLGGVTGRKSAVPIDFDRLEAAAKKKLSREAFAYTAGGAGLESTMAANLRAFERVRIVPRVLRDVSQRDTSIELFGRRYPAPFLLAPVGVLGIVHPEGDLAVARAAAAEGIPFTFSNQASVAMETCADAMGDARRWFQLYTSKSDDVVRSLVQRAEACGCGAIVVTLDTTLLGWRPRDLDLTYLPFALAEGIAQYTSDPAFMAKLERGDTVLDERQGRITPAMVRTLFRISRAYPGSFWSNLKSTRPRLAVTQFVQIYSRPRLTWNDLAFLRGLTRLPILLKGVLHPDDARKALDHHVDGIVVSNHGGRQVDGAIAALDALPEIMNAVGDRLPVLLDSGVRGGADILKALALGARAVMIGRAYLWGLAANGQAGVENVLDILRAGTDSALLALGHRSVRELSPDDVIVPSGFTRRLGAVDQ